MNTKLQSRIYQLRESAINNSFKSDELLNLIKDCISQRPSNEYFHQLLEIAHISNVSKNINKSKQTDIWFKYLLEIIKISRFNVGYLLKQRAEVYKNKAALHIIKKGKVYNVSYDSLWKRVIEVGKGLSLFNNQGKKPTVGLLTHNQLNGALVDLACLSFGYKVVPIPLNSTPEHVSYIINHSEISHLFIGGNTGDRVWNEIKD